MKSYISEFVRLGCASERAGWKTIRFKVALPALFQEIASHTEVLGCPGAITGLEIIKVCLYNIARRAMEIQDVTILEELEVMGVIHPLGETRGEDF